MWQTKSLKERDIVARELSSLITREERRRRICEERVQARGAFGNTAVRYSGHRSRQRCNLLVGLLKKAKLNRFVFGERTYIKRVMPHGHGDLAALQIPTGSPTYILGLAGTRKSRDTSERATEGFRDQATGNGGGVIKVCKRLRCEVRALRPNCKSNAVVGIGMSTLLERERTSTTGDTPLSSSGSIEFRSSLNPFGKTACTR